MQKMIYCKCCQIHIGEQDEEIKDHGWDNEDILYECGECLAEFPNQSQALKCEENDRADAQKENQNG